jgi:8-oxo-dGTP diphosphatase
MNREASPAGGHAKARGPALTVDVIIEIGSGAPRQVVLVRRRNPPPGWALPGGFVDYGETVEAAARREAKEETGLDVILSRQFHVYSEPARDPRGHTVAVVFAGSAAGSPKGGDDASEARVFPVDQLPADMAFDHRQVIEDYIKGTY